MFRALLCSSSGGGAGTCLKHIEELKQISLINVLYVNKQEFCTANWRSNQG